MYSILYKAFSGFSLGNYLKHFLLGTSFPILLYYVANATHTRIELDLYIFSIVNTLLYPYSRWLYLKAMHYLCPASFTPWQIIFSFFNKLTTIYVCWMFALVILPIGLVYGYRQQKNDNHN